VSASEDSGEDVWICSQAVDYLLTSNDLVLKPLLLPLLLLQGLGYFIEIVHLGA
jgi:hypothetical protein